jgi:hypothetical protein
MVIGNKTVVVDNSSMKTTKQSKKEYFDRVYLAAPIIECNCGCGTKIKSKDKYGRDKKFVNGHNRRKYKNPSQYKREWNHNNREARYSYKAQRLHKIMVELILNAGGKCNNCGLEFDGKCTSVFDFHHIDPKQKKFNINKGSINRYNIESTNEEVKKCILLCANCHRIHHHNYFINTANSQ